MNYSRAIFLVNDAVRAIATSYELEPDGKTGKKPFVVYKSMDPVLAVGEFVVVPSGTRHGMTVVRVEELDVEVDQASGVELAWIIDTVSSADHDTVVSAEKAAIERIKSAEKAALQRELRDKLLADNPDIAALKGVNLGAQPALAAPPTEKD